MNLDSIRLAIKSSWDIQSEKFVSLHEPQFQGNDWNYVKDCLDSGWVSSVGKYVDLFEEKIKEFTGSKYAIATVNGTAALHITLRLSDVKQDDEVLLPALTFVATANAVSYCHATPHFIDVEKETLGIDPSKLELYLREIVIKKNEYSYNKNTNKRISALIGMHTFGHSFDIDRVKDICDYYNIAFIEDAAESLGSFYKGKHTGTYSKLAAISFNGNKIVTTGGGGAILTQDENIAKLAKHITTTAKVPHKWEFFHDMIGYNYRMPNLNAALGCAQLEVLPKYLKFKRKLANNYIINFKNVEGVKIFSEPKFSISNYWLNVMLVENSTFEKRDMVLENLNHNNIMARPAWNLLNNLPMFSHSPKMDLSESIEIEKSLINIPSSSNLIINE
ncbi:MAG: LegC family aminotransferase [Leptospira sp.]|nr:LegC family aminotransferase [Leptospira sp.]